MMNISYCVLICVILPVSVFAQKQNRIVTPDTEKLNTLPVLWQRYWNFHNMDSMGTLLRDDVDFVNVAGSWLRGKEATVSDHKQKHAGIIFKNSVWTTDSFALKLLRPDLAVIHLYWGVKGDNDPDGTPRTPRHGIFTWIVTRIDNDWKILISQNTNIRELVPK